MKKILIKHDSIFDLINSSACKFIYLYNKLLHFVGYILHY